ncbi:thiolase family protein [Planctomycetaceae bacterium]|jgi:acetyl-CoA C-acetyltransferase|nr:thiolase family protein [Planctomycetaceae bacterium]MDC0274011.1 thiolase family protein [Planctomycetaceae bacterium]MDG2390358.1 thiolase family protein [Planctomycetaceae bacterium]
MKRVVIVSAKRTPFGRFLGQLSKLSPVELAVAAGEAALDGVDRSLVEQVILGNVLSAGHGMNIARQVSIQLGLPVESSATTINMMCGSGMQSAMLAVNAIRAGDANAVLAGGTESMSQSALLVNRPEKRQQPDISNLTDTMQSDGLIDTFSQRHMGEQAEDLAEEFAISSEQQNLYALRSQHLFAAAQERGAYQDELVSVGDVAEDQHPRPSLTVEELSGLKPIFRKAGTVTAGNASGVNDGAAVLLLAEREFALAQGWSILAEWGHGVSVGCEPSRMGLGPVHAILALMKRTSQTWNDVDTLEINEAFAAQTLACLQALTLKITPDEQGSKVMTSTGRLVNFNSEGGAIAVGHPLAVSGARLLTHLSWKIFRGESESAIGALCIGGGQGIATSLVRG